MTLIYARIANRVVADEYQAVSAQIDALYGQPPQLPADCETTGMARLRREAHARMLGNGLCTPAAPARLPHGIRLRDLRLLPDHHRVPAHPPAPTTPATTASPNAPHSSASSSSESTRKMLDRVVVHSGRHRLTAPMGSQCVRYLLCGLFPAAQGRPPLSCGGP
jgi:hypothetical protein